EGKRRRRRLRERARGRGGLGAGRALRALGPGELARDRGGAPDSHAARRPARRLGGRLSPRRDAGLVRRFARVVGAALVALVVAGMTTWAALAIFYSDLPSATLRT